MKKMKNPSMVQAQICPVSLDLQFVGIDVSKSDLHISRTVLWEGKPTQSYEKIANSTSSIEEFLGRQSDWSSVQFVFEATGVYSNRLELLLSQKGIKFSKMNGLRVKQFSNSWGNLQKDDRSDARMIQLFGEKFTPPVSKPLSEQVLIKKRLTQVLSLIEKQLQTVQMQFHLLENDPVEVVMVRSMYENMQADLLEKKAEILKELATFAPQSAKEDLDLLQTIPGIGPRSAQLLWEATTGFSDFDNAKQVVRYVGLAPVEEHSGNKRLKKGICNAAHPTLRASLYMAAMSAKKYNDIAKQLFERLRQKGKPVKVAIIAVAHLLVRIAFAIIKYKKPFQSIPLGKDEM